MGLETLGTTLELGEKFVSIFDTLKKKLWGDEEKASAKLAEVIDEMLKFYKATHSEISSFMGMDFSMTIHNQANRKALYDIIGGSLDISIRQAKGNCGLIKKIYEENLDKPFKKHLSQEEYWDLNRIFKSLSEYDYSMIDAATELEKELKIMSENLINTLDTHNAAQAESYQIDNRKKFMPTQKRLSELMGQLLSLKEEV